jgi:hypothetical protein
MLEITSSNACCVVDECRRANLLMWILTLGRSVNSNGGEKPWVA